jgi:hypothetical protein
MGVPGFLTANEPDAAEPQPNGVAGLRDPSGIGSAKRRSMGWPPSGTMHESSGSTGSTGANGSRWRPIKMGISEIVIGNHRATISPSVLRMGRPMAINLPRHVPRLTDRRHLMNDSG